MTKSSSPKSGPTTISHSLLSWYDRHARALPWRVPPLESKAGARPDPYRIWLSEIMLQQTTVATVKERYQRFLKTWPSVADLAAAPLDDVLAEWAGLGYYARARNLHKCAVVVVQDYDGMFPQTEEELLSLPGIGPYTAAAVASIAFGAKAVVMDGNIERVMARLFAEEMPLPDAKPVLKGHAADLTPKSRAGDHAQALMDLGATICTPRNPLCALCPLNKKCLAYDEGIAASLPVKKKKGEKPVRYGAVYILTRDDDAVWLVRRPEKGLLGGMQALPTSEWTSKVASFAPPVETEWTQIPKQVKHTFTHFHLYLDIYLGALADEGLSAGGSWHEDPQNAGLPTVFLKALNATLGAG